MKRILLTMMTFCIGTLLMVQAQSGYQVGDEAADFSLKNVDGEMVTLSTYVEEAEGYIVVFTCNTCPWAQLYEDRIIALDDKYRDQGYPVVAINPNDPNKKPGDSFAQMVVRADEKEFSFPYLVDEKQDVAAAYGATRTPHTYLLQKDAAGKFFVRYIGAIDDAPRNADDVNDYYVEQAISQLKAGEDVSVPFTNAIGCSIKWIQ